MKVFVVFAAVIAVAAAGAVRNAGWGASPPALPVIDLELGAAAAAAGAGSADAGQSVVELVSGNAAAPATLVSSSGVAAGVEQGEDIAQVAVANIPSGATSTINAVDVYQDAYAVDSLEAALSGANAASVQNAANTAAAGEGAIAAEASSLNNVQSGSGWKKN